jgi:hypothetical protein
MGLRNIIIRRLPVTVDAEQEFEVRGLNAADLMGLVTDHGPTLATMFGKVMQASSKQERLDDDMTRTILTSLAGEAPEVLAAIIAFAADEYSADGIDSARKLTFLVQMDALMKVFKLTFTTDGALEKFSPLLTQMILRAAEAVRTQPMEMPLGDGIGASVVN